MVTLTTYALTQIPDFKFVTSIALTPPCSWNKQQALRKQRQRDILYPIIQEEFFRAGGRFLEIIEKLQI